MAKTRDIKYPTWKIFIQIVQYVCPHKFFWAGLILLSFVLIIVNLIDPLILKFLIDDVLVRGDYRMLVYAILALAAVQVLSLALTYIYSIGSSKFYQNFYLAVRNDLFEHLQYKHIGFFSKKEVGELLRTLMVDVYDTQTLLSVVETVLGNTVRLIAILSIIFVLEWRLALIGLAMVPVYALFQLLFMKRIRKEAGEARQANVNLFNFFEERLANIFLVKLFSKEKTEVRTGQELGEEYARERVELVSVVFLVSVLISAVTSAVIIAVLWFGAVEVIKGALTIGGLIAIYTYIAKMFGPIAALVAIPSSIQESLIAADRVIRTLSAPEETKSAGREVKVDHFRGKISFDHVSFAYSEKRGGPILRDLTFEVAPGETVAIVGGSGSGKTSIVRLLLRFFEPQKGEITLDDLPLNSIARSSLRGRIGVVPQDSLLLPASVRVNIAYANPDATQERVEQAAKAAGIHEKVASLTDGYETHISADGKPFSAGELQRICIARALLKNPDIFIFDEPTAELDPKTERLIAETIKTVTENKTAILIAHRPRTLECADRILVLMDGKIEEEGTPEELKAKNGEFVRLFRT